MRSSFQEVCRLDRILVKLFRFFLNVNWRWLARGPASWLRCNFVWKNFHCSLWLYSLEYWFHSQIPQFSCEVDVYRWISIPKRSVNVSRSATHDAPLKWILSAIRGEENMVKPLNGALFLLNVGFITHRCCCCTYHKLCNIILQQEPIERFHNFFGVFCARNDF